MRPNIPAIFSEPSLIKWFDALPGETFSVRIDSQSSGHRFAMAEVIVQPSYGPPLHIHHDTDEVIYVVRGIFDFVCEERRFRSGPGGVVVIPRGAKHAFRNSGREEGRLLGFLPSGGLEQLFKRMEGRPPEDMLELAAQHHMAIVGPMIENDGI